MGVKYKLLGLVLMVLHLIASRNLLIRHPGVLRKGWGSGVLKGEGPNERGLNTYWSDNKNGCLILPLNLPDLFSYKLSL